MFLSLNRRVSSAVLQLLISTGKCQMFNSGKAEKEKFYMRLFEFSWILGEKWKGHYFISRKSCQNQK
jgi:hypothetical protein